MALRPMEADVVFVTGAAGYVGRFLVRRLLDASLRVRCLALPAESIEPLAGLPVEIVRGDITRLETFVEHGHGVGSIVHAASAMLPNPPALVKPNALVATSNAPDPSSSSSCSWHSRWP